MALPALAEAPRCAATVLLSALLVASAFAATADASPASDSTGGSATARAARASRASSGVGGGLGSALGGPRLRRFPLLLSPSVPLDALDDDDDALFEANKRQMSDDYGHMRFGKRGGGDNDFAEYGHMRFGRAAA